MWKWSTKRFDRRLNFYQTEETDDFRRFGLFLFVGLHSNSKRENLFHHIRTSNPNWTTPTCASSRNDKNTLAIAIRERKRMTHFLFLLHRHHIVALLRWGFSSKDENYSMDHRWMLRRWKFRFTWVLFVLRTAPFSDCVSVLSRSTGLSERVAILLLLSERLRRNKLMRSTMKLFHQYTTYQYSNGLFEATNVSKSKSTSIDLFGITAVHISIPSSFFHRNIRSDDFTVADHWTVFKIKSNVISIPPRSTSDNT